MVSEQIPQQGPGPGSGPPPAGRSIPEPPAQAPQVPGATHVSEAAVARVAAAAARAIDGVHSLGTGAGRAFGALRGRVSGAQHESTVGVSAEVGREEVAVDLTLIADYGRPLHAIAADVRAAVFASVEELTGLRVIEVNIEIGDIHVPTASGSSPATGAIPAIPAAPAAAPPPAPGAPPAGAEPADPTTPDGERA